MFGSPSPILKPKKNSGGLQQSSEHAVEITMTMSEFADPHVKSKNQQQDFPDQLPSIDMSEIISKNNRDSRNPNLAGLTGSSIGRSLEHDIQNFV